MSVKKNKTKTQQCYKNDNNSGDNPIHTNNNDKKEHQHNHGDSNNKNNGVIKTATEMIVMKIVIIIIISAKIVSINQVLITIRTNPVVRIKQNATSDTVFNVQSQ